MKRSKLFLAAATCLLAVVGVAATKAHKTDVTGFYYLTGGQCLNNPNGIICTATPTTPCTYTRSGASGPSTVYQSNISSICTTPLYKVD